MKIIKPSKVELLDIFAIIYILFTLFLINMIANKGQLLINLILIMYYFRIRFIK